MTNSTHPPASPHEYRAQHIAHAKEPLPPKSDEQDQSSPATQDPTGETDIPIET